MVSLLWLRAKWSCNTFSCMRPYNLNNIILYWITGGGSCFLVFHQAHAVKATSAGYQSATPSFSLLLLILLFPILHSSICDSRMMRVSNIQFLKLSKAQKVQRKFVITFVSFFFPFNLYSGVSSLGTHIMQGTARAITQEQRWGLTAEGQVHLASSSH